VWLKSFCFKQQDFNLRGCPFCGHVAVL